MYNRIADALRQQIVSGVLPPGAELPPEGELAVQWKSSRGPVRNALGALRAEGLIETTRGRPSRVLSRKARQAADVYIPFTRWAESFGRKPSARTEALGLRRADAVTAQALNVEPGTLIVDLTRLRMLDGVPTMLERTSFIEHVGRLLFEVDLDTVSITEYLASRGHRFSGVTHEIDAVAANDVDARMLEVELGSPILRLRRTSVDANGTAFEYSDDRYRSDIVRFTVDASGRQADGSHLIQPK
ncbi:GntR family transcriptional regulator [Arthrobacter jiangjiafuii]|uniref:GntR family transcriptional regulator n=2 Tax=Arthrobacter jiangjiafuii TaxID=2817475 RepID=A0A975R2H0_9MICC|nr:GntR family transcriptional regulator [Arthrobacter jiangjiafuii]QWC11583.1 GntR family transcriptional regulator [Arthrobacter jiangjiafuii]